MEYAELRKFRKRMSEGSGSSRVTEALLEMYWREGLSVDAAFAQYTKTRFGTDIENAERMCDKIVKTARENLRMEKYNAQKTADLLKAVYEFVEQTQRCFCESICQRERYQDSPCPVKQLVEFINWLEKELDVLCQAPKRNGTLIAMTGSYAQQDVCDIWSLSKQTVNTIIARMVQKGLVHLEAMPGAKNRKCIHLTNAGERYGQRIVGPVLDAEQRAIARLDAGESLACTTMLKRYIQVLKEELRGMKCREQKRGNGGLTISEIF